MNVVYNSKTNIFMDLAERRDEIIFGSFDPDSYMVGGIRRFSGLSPEKLERLVAIKAADKRESQNLAPSIEEFLAYGKRNPGKTSFEGYAVTPLRDDFRVSIDGVTAEFDSMSDMADFVNTFRLADSFSIDECGGYAWFD